MNIQQTIGFIAAAANPFPLQASFSEMAGGKYKCKLCGDEIKDQSACADHLIEKHREMESRDFSQGKRRSLAKSGDAMPGGSFPIENRSDLANAKQAIGRAKNPGAARAHINERAKALGAKPIGAQTEFAPSMRERMPKKAGTGQMPQNPQYTGGQPTFQAAKKPGCCDACNERAKMEALGFKVKTGGCGGGFHKGTGYSNKAAKMGHRLTLAAAAERPVLVRQRPQNRKKVSYSFRGYQGAA
jgi:hypothetical protein